MNLLENKDLAWERFQKVVTDEDMAVCYDMSLKNLNTLLFMISSWYVFFILFSFHLVIFHISLLINFFNQLRM